MIVLPACNKLYVFLNTKHFLMSTESVLKIPTQRFDQPKSKHKSTLLQQHANNKMSESKKDAVPKDKKQQDKSKQKKGEVVQQLVCVQDQTFIFFSHIDRLKKKKKRSKIWNFWFKKSWIPNPACKSRLLKL